MFVGPYAGVIRATAFTPLGVDSKVPFRFGVWKKATKPPWTRPRTASSTEATVTWCCTPTEQEAKRITSSTSGEHRRIRLR